MSYYPPRPNFSTPTAAERNRLFGTFQYRNNGDGTIKILGGWASENIVRVEIPQLVGVEGAPKTGVVLFHKKGAVQLQEFFEAVEEEGLKHLILTWAGSFYPRFIRGSRTSLSNHSWGTAFDINAAWNGLGRQPAPVGAKGSLLKIVPIANEFGFFWGGHYNSRLDGMHFELAVPNRFRKPVLSTAQELREPVVVTISAADQTEPPAHPPQSEPSGSLSETGQPSNPSTETKVVVQDGNVKVETSENKEPQKKIAVEKPERKGFIATIRTEIAALVAGNGGFQALIDKAQQAQVLGLSARFWTILALLALTGSLVYLLYRWLDYSKDAKRDEQITKQLIEANSTPDNQVYLVDKDRIDFLDEKKFEVIRR